MAYAKIGELLKRADDVNLAEGLPEEDLNKIGSVCRRGYDEDQASRAQWLKDNGDYIKMAMQVIEKKTFPWPDAANVKFPLLLVAALQFHARAYPAIVPGRNIVKGSVIGYDPTGEKAKAAERVGKHMSYQLLEEMPEWEEDMDKGTLILPISGCFFKKTYFDPETGKNVSKAVWADKLVVNYHAPSLDRAPRVSEEFELYPQEIKERQMSGIWRNVDISYVDREKEHPELFVEQHTRYDLDDDGYKEPYIITFHKESSKVMRIVARYDEDGLFFKEGRNLVNVGKRRREVVEQNQIIAQQNQMAAQIAQDTVNAGGQFIPPVMVGEIQEPNWNKIPCARIEPEQMYTKFMFLPSPDGGFYDVGFGQLLGALSGAIDTTINQMLDASTLANLGGGFKAKSAKIPAGTMRAGVGEYVDIETNGMPIRDSILDFKFRGPTPSSFNLLSLLIQQAKDIANIKDILLGDQPDSTTATSSMIAREEGTKVFTAIYKRIYRALKHEMQKLYRLNRKYLPEEAYFMVLDTPEAVFKQDYSFDETNIAPVCDPTVATQSQRLIKAQAMLAFAQDPDVDGYEIKRSYFQALDTPNVDAIIPPKDQLPPPEPPPEMLLAAANLVKTQVETELIKEQIKKTKAESIKMLADAESKEVGTQIESYKAQYEALGHVKKEKEEQEENDGQGTGNGMEAPGIDQGGIQAPEMVEAAEPGDIGNGDDIGEPGELGEGGNAGI